MLRLCGRVTWVEARKTISADAEFVLGEWEPPAMIRPPLNTPAV